MMFEGDSADMRAGKFPLVSMGGRAEGLVCADPVARTPIGASGNTCYIIPRTYLNIQRVPEKTIFHLAHSKFNKNGLFGSGKSMFGH